MLIKEKLLYNNQDKKIKVSLSNTNKVYGDDQELDKFIFDEKEENINPPIDKEVTLFKFSKEIENPLGVIFGVNFHYNNDYDDNDLLIDYTYAGFTKSELYNYVESLRNSFFILEFFDHYDPKKRTKITTNYYTKIWKIYRGWNHQEAVEFNKTNQLKFTSISNKHLKKFNNEFSLYLRILFYNAKKGRIVSFFNNDYHAGQGFLTLKTERPLFFKTFFNKKDRTWYTEDNALIAFEMFQQNDYLDKLNDTNENIEDLRISYPPKEVFDYKTGEYKDQEDVE